MPSKPPPWASLSAEEHEFQYNPQKAFPDFGKHQTARAPVNAQARSGLKAHYDARYGEHALHALDVFPAAEAGSAVHLFLRGGEWRAPDKQDVFCVPGAMLPRGY